MQTDGSPPLLLLFVVPGGRQHKHWQVHEFVNIANREYGDPDWVLGCGPNQWAYDFVKSPFNMLSRLTFSMKTSLLPCISHTSCVSVLISTISPPASDCDPV